MVYRSASKTRLGPGEAVLLVKHLSSAVTGALPVAPGTNRLASCLLPGDHECSEAGDVAWNKAVTEGEHARGNDS